MENAIEICSGCGKMPRSIDTSGGQFVCIRCGNRTTMQVSADNYEKVASALDARFHSHMLKQKLISARSEPIIVKVPPRKTVKVVKKKASKKKPLKGKKKTPRKR